MIADGQRHVPAVSPIRGEVEPKPIQLVFKHLCRKVEKENPQQFRLPQDIRQFFAGGELVSWV